LIQIIWLPEYFLNLFEPDSTLRILPQPLALARIEVETHWYNCYTTVLRGINPAFVLHFSPFGA
jgi:hypothetical protein